MASSWTWVAAPTAIYAFVKEKGKRRLASLMNKELIPAASPQTVPSRSAEAALVFVRRGVGKRVDHAKSVLFRLSQIARNHFIG